MDLTHDTCTIVLRHAAAQSGVQAVLLRFACVNHVWHAAALSLAQDDKLWESAVRRTGPVDAFTQLRELASRSWQQLYRQRADGVRRLLDHARRQPHPSNTYSGKTAAA